MDESAEGAAPPVEADASPALLVGMAAAARLDIAAGPPSAAVGAAIRVLSAAVPVRFGSARTGRRWTRRNVGGFRQGKDRGKGDPKGGAPRRDDPHAMEKTLPVADVHAGSFGSGGHQATGRWSGFIQRGW